MVKPKLATNKAVCKTKDETESKQKTIHLFKDPISVWELNCMFYDQLL